MKTTRTRIRTSTIRLAAALATATLPLFPATSLADDAIWTGDDNGNGNWSDTTNWTPTPATAPGAGNTATITGTSASRTITYDASASGQLGALTLAQAEAGYANTLVIAKTPTTSAPALTLASDLALGGDATAGEAILQINSAATNATTLKIGDATTRGTLTFDTNSRYIANSANSGPILDANIVLNSGSTFQLNTTSSIDARTIILGDFTANGGATIERVAGNAGQGHLQLRGATNIFGAGVIFSDASAAIKGLPIIYLNSTDAQSLTTESNISKLAFRNASGVKTLSGTGTITELQLGGHSATTDITLKLGSDLASTSGFATGNWGNNTAGAAFALDTNGHTFAVTNTLTFLNVGANAITWNIQNTDSANAGAIVAPTIIFSNTATSTVSGNITLETTSTADNGGFNFNSATVNIGAGVTLKSNKPFNFSKDTTTNAAAIANVTLAEGVTLHHTGTGESNLGDRQGIHYRYTGTTGNFTSTGTPVSIEVGDGTTSSTLTRTINALSSPLSGDLTIRRNATYNSGGWATSLTGAASITGNGTFHAVNGSGSVTWTVNSTGGLSPGEADGETGTLTFSAASTGNTTIPTINLAATSITTFDIASATDYDTVNLGAFNIKFAGTLYLNFLDGYIPEDGATLALFTRTSETNANGTITGTTSGAFTTIASNLADSDYTLAFDATTGAMTVAATPVPEPATTATLAALAALAITLAATTRKPRKP
ncbi:MAG: PEP-CTERM sorting domain-containing protein [Opitutaceae bacterium]|jgi:hypothetical protein|nr:PEP-CTERM sorting domain-containing protein [Opitutaceae bacterium]